MSAEMQIQFVIDAQALIESTVPTAGPFYLMYNNDNVSTLYKMTALIVTWVGTADNSVTKTVYKVWYVDGVMQKALVAKSEWPSNI